MNVFINIIGWRCDAMSGRTHCLVDKVIYWGGRTEKKKDIAVVLCDYFEGFDGEMGVITMDQRNQRHLVDRVGFERWSKTEMKEQHKEIIRMPKTISISLGIFLSRKRNLLYLKASKSY